MRLFTSQSFLTHLSSHAWRDARFDVVVPERLVFANGPDVQKAEPAKVEAAEKPEVKALKSSLDTTADLERAAADLVNDNHLTQKKIDSITTKVNDSLKKAEGLKSKVTDQTLILRLQALTDANASNIVAMNKKMAEITKDRTEKLAALTKKYERVVANPPLNEVPVLNDKAQKFYSEGRQGIGDLDTMSIDKNVHGDKIDVRAVMDMFQELDKEGKMDLAGDDEDPGTREKENFGHQRDVYMDNKMFSYAQGYALAYAAMHPEDPNAMATVQKNMEKLHDDGGGRVDQEPLLKEAGVDISEIESVAKLDALKSLSAQDRKDLFLTSVPPMIIASYLKNAAAQFKDKPEQLEAYKQYVGKQLLGMSSQLAFSTRDTLTQKVYDADKHYVLTARRQTNLVMAGIPTPQDWAKGGENLKKYADFTPTAPVSDTETTVPHLTESTDRAEWQKELGDYNTLLTQALNLPLDTPTNNDFAEKLTNARAMISGEKLPISKVPPITPESIAKDTAKILEIADTIKEDILAKLDAIAKNSSDATETTTAATYRDNLIKTPDILTLSRTDLGKILQFTKEHFKPAPAPAVAPTVADGAAGAAPAGGDASGGEKSAAAPAGDAKGGEATGGVDGSSGKIEKKKERTPEEKGAKSRKFFEEKKDVIDGAKLQKLLGLKDPVDKTSNADLSAAIKKLQGTAKELKADGQFGKRTFDHFAKELQKETVKSPEVQTELQKQLDSPDFIRERNKILKELDNGEKDILQEMRIQNDNEKMSDITKGDFRAHREAGPYWIVLPQQGASDKLQALYEKNVSALKKDSPEFKKKIADELHPYFTIQDATTGKKVEQSVVDAYKKGKGDGAKPLDAPEKVDAKVDSTKFIDSVEGLPTDLKARYDALTLNEKSTYKDYLTKSRDAQIAVGKGEETSTNKGVDMHATVYMDGGKIVWKEGYGPTKDSLRNNKTIPDLNEWYLKKLEAKHPKPEDLAAKAKAEADAAAKERAEKRESDIKTANRQLTDEVKFVIDRLQPGAPHVLFSAYPLTEKWQDDLKAEKFSIQKGADGSLTFMKGGNAVEPEVDPQVPPLSPENLQKAKTEKARAEFVRIAKTVITRNFPKT